jgi:hypothetical protein
MAKQVIRVLKPFMFSHPAVVGVKLATETKFMPGDHEVPDAIANHPWIQGGADGRVETAAQAQERAEYEKRKAAAAKVEADAANAAAAAAVARAKTTEPVTKVTGEGLEEELNTPVNEIQRRRAAGQSVASTTAAKAAAAK